MDDWTIWASFSAAGINQNKAKKFGLLIGGQELRKGKSLLFFPKGAKHF